MPSKKAAGSKRASLSRVPDFSKDFLKDWQRLTHSSRSDVARLKEVMVLLIAGNAPLGTQWLDHPLKGRWAHHRECHVSGDFLLTYDLDDARVNFVRAGTHTDRL